MFSIAIDNLLALDVFQIKAKYALQQIDEGLNDDYGIGWVVGIALTFKTCVVVLRVLFLEKFFVKSVLK